MRLKKRIEVSKVRKKQDLERELFMGPLPDLVAKLSFFRRLERTWQLIEKDYVDPDLGLEKAARTSGVCKNHLNVLLRQTTGFTFHQILIRYRLVQAISMMESKNYTVLEITLANGFKSRNSFENNFRRLIGTTPKKFRANRDFL